VGTTTGATSVGAVVGWVALAMFGKLLHAVALNASKTNHELIAIIDSLLGDMVTSCFVVALIIAGLD
jgi:hypothetical protein